MKVYLFLFQDKHFWGYTGLYPQGQPTLAYRASDGHRRTPIRSAAAPHAPFSIHQIKIMKKLLAFHLL